MRDPAVLAACEPVRYGPPPGDRFAPGVLSAAAGLAAYDALVRAVEDAMAGRVDAIATAPVNKEAWALAGLPWRGHTDLLAHLTGASSMAMMFYSRDAARGAGDRARRAGRRRRGCSRASAWWT